MCEAEYEIEGLYDCYLNKILFNSCKYYRGTFCCDEIPSCIAGESKASLIVNLSPSDVDGSHFITIILKPDEVQYIDSLGFDCFSDDINNFLVSCNRNVKIHSTRIQSLSSTFCGFFCMALCLYHERKRTKSLTYYSNDLKRNDVIVLWYISNLLREIKKGK